jgi:ABC-type antimicrobial peptide transport system permease subunit
MYEVAKGLIEADPRMTVDVKRETQYYLDQSEAMAKFLRILGLSLTIIFSLGAVIGAMITMYAAVANRVTEIGTLRAIGFQRGDILAAFVLEAAFLGLLGGILGTAAASLLQLVTISTMNWQSFAELAFSFALTPGIVLKSLLFGVGMGLAGGVLPAFRAARLPVVEALRAT